MAFPPEIRLSEEMKDLLVRLLQKVFPLTGLVCTIVLIHNAEQDESLRISWSDFFLHPCVDLSNDCTDEPSSISYSDLLNKIEMQESTVEQLKKYSSTFSFIPATHHTTN